MSATKCENCRFWKALDGDGQEFWGECKRFPPCVAFGSDPLSGPQTSSNDWCGEFKPRPTEDVAKSLDVTEVLGRSVEWLFEDVPASELQAAGRARNALLRRAKIGVVGQLIQLRRFELLELKNTGLSTVNYISRRLAKYGLALKGESLRDYLP